MVDFKNNILEEGDEVIFIYDKFQTNKLVEGTIVNNPIAKARGLCLKFLEQKF
jgi:uncharacterized Zn ribbon protein